MRKLVVGFLCTAAVYSIGMSQPIAASANELVAIGNSSQSCGGTANQKLDWYSLLQGSTPQLATGAKKDRCCPKKCPKLDKVKCDKKGTTAGEVEHKCTIPDLYCQFLVACEGESLICSGTQDFEFCLPSNIPCPQ